MLIFAIVMTHTLNIRGQLLTLATPQVMGILNATPDSFFSGSRKQTEREVADRANEIVAQGGSIIDVGAFSTRPGAAMVSQEEELQRLQWALRVVRREQPTIPISVDTYRPEVAQRCVEEWGADIINDVSEGGITGIVGQPIQERGSMFEMAGRLGVPYILMSVRPTVEEMIFHWSREVEELRDYGVADIILDPGYCFGKTLEQNYAILHQAEKLQALDLPILVGVSRKSMIFKVTEGTPDTALNGTTVVHTLSLTKGANILRVHDVREAVETVRIVSAMQQQQKSLAAQS